MVNRGLEPTGFEPLDRLLDLLDDVHAANGHFEGMCPGHVGQRRALKITLGEKDGKPFPLLHCHAGCETKDILEELGLGWSDLHEDGRPGPRAGKQTTARGLQGTIEAIYDYVNLAGELVFQVVRYKDPKDFRQRTPNGSGGWIWSVKDIKPLPLYHLPEVVKAVSAKVPVTVLEGEKDVDRARDELGITATTCPEGADKWDPTHSQYLRGADVVLVPDNDGPGCKHMESVGRELLKVARSVKLLELPGLGDGGDLSDWIDAGGTAKEYRALVKEAPLFLHHQGMESDEERKPLSMSVAEFIAEAGERADWIVEGILAKGSITSIAGLAKFSGKTTYVTHMVERILAGMPFLERRTKEAKAVYATEQGNNFVDAMRKADLLEADAENLRLIPYKRTADMAWTTVVENAVAECKDYGADVLVIDTFAEFAEIRGTEENNSGDIAEKMVPLKKAARVEGLAVVVTRHSGKDGRGRGSSQFEAEVDVVIELKRGEGDSSETERKVESIGRYDAATYKETIELTEEGYITHGYVGASSTLNQAKTVIEQVVPEGREGAISKREVWERVQARPVETTFSESSLDRALDELLEAGEILRYQGSGKGRPWLYFFLHQTPIPSDEERKDNKDLGPKDPDLHGPGDKAPVPTSEVIEDEFSLRRVITMLEDPDVVALDLETMPSDPRQPGLPVWFKELSFEYRTWYSTLKTKPKKKRRREFLEKQRARLRKKYATDPETAEVRLVSIATKTGLNVLVDATRVDIKPLLEMLKGKTLLVHHASFDLGVLYERYEYLHDGQVLDTELLYILYHYAEDGDRTELRDGKWRVPDPTKTKVTVDDKEVGMTSLLHIVKRFLPDVELDKDQQGSDWSIPELGSQMRAYALKDSAVLLDLVEVLKSRLSDIEMDRTVELESRVLPAKAWMERNGMPASKDVALQMADTYHSEAKAALARMWDLLPADAKTAPGGEAWTWTKASHVRTVLELLGVDLDKLPKTGKTKEPSTSKSSLAAIEGPAEAVCWVEAYLSYDRLRKSSTDFVDKYINLIREDGTIAGRFETISTGRFKCVKPNLQQVPGRGELQTTEGMRVRDIFRARDGELLVIADFSQVELLLAATIAERESKVESKMLEVFRKGGLEGDIHRVTAATILNKALEDVTKEERTLAKAINFGLIYGCSAERLLDTATNSYGVKNMRLADAERYREAFFEKYPEFEVWHAKVRKACRRGKDYATTPEGRRRKLPKYDKTREIAFTTAVNHPVQGAGADAIKHLLALAYERRNQAPSKVVLNCLIHDESILSTSAEDAERVCEWVKDLMAEAERKAVLDPESPIHVDVEAYTSWAKAS